MVVAGGGLDVRKHLGYPQYVFPDLQRSQGICKEVCLSSQKEDAAQGLGKF